MAQENKERQRLSIVNKELDVTRLIDQTFTTIDDRQEVLLQRWKYNYNRCTCHPMIIA
jgi:hypothetical protein